MKTRVGESEALHAGFRRAIIRVEWKLGDPKPIVIRLIHSSGHLITVEDVRDIARAESIPRSKAISWLRIPSGAAPSAPAAEQALEL